MNYEIIEATFRSLAARTQQEFDNAVACGADKLLLITTAYETHDPRGLPVMPMLVLANVCTTLLGELWPVLTDAQRVQLGCVAASAAHYERRTSEIGEALRGVVSAVRDKLAQEEAEAEAKASTKQ